MLGGAFGLAVLASLAAAHTQSFSATNANAIESLNSGYHIAFGVGAAFAFVAALIGYFGIRATAVDLSHAAH
jgi:hypothetical protein